MLTPTPESEVGVNMKYGPTAGTSSVIIDVSIVRDIY